MRKVLFALALLFALMALLPATADSETDWTAIPRQGQVAIGLTGGLTQPVGQLGRAVSLDADIGDSGLNLDRGVNGGVFADYFFTHRFAVGVFANSGMLHMKKITLQTESGPQSFEKLVEGRTTQFGLYAKYFLRPRGAWSSYGFAGAAHVDRKAQLSRDVLALYPGTTVFEIRDDCVGFVGGIGSDYEWSDRLSVGVVAAYDYSGQLAHDFPWMGHQTIVHDWQFVTLHAALTWHLGVGQ